MTATATRPAVGGPLVSLIRLLSSNLVTRSKLSLAGVVALGWIGLGVTVRRFGATEDILQLVYDFGLALTVPILSLLISTAFLGDPVEDETLVYIWLRPISRTLITVAAWFSALLITVLAIVLPITVAVGLGSGFDPSAMAAASGSVALAVMAYSALFMLVGLVIRRSLIVGLLYVFIWEFFVARVGAGAARLSINTYPSGALDRWADVDLLNQFTAEAVDSPSLVAAVLVPFGVALAAVAATTWRLRVASVA